MITTIFTILFIWVTNFMINVFLGAVLMNFDLGIKLTYTQRNFKDNKTPIYKLYKGDYDSCYKVHKYELTYIRPDNFWFYNIPFSFLFMVYGYKPNDKKYGLYNAEMIESGYANNLKNIWESGHEEHLINMKSRNAFKDKLNNINKEFINNYK